MNFFGYDIIAQKRPDQPQYPPEPDNNNLRDPFNPFANASSDFFAQRLPDQQRPTPEIKTIDNNPFGNPFGGIQGTGQNVLGAIQSGGQNAIGGIQGARQNAIGGIQGVGQNALGAGQNALGGIQGVGQNALGGIQGAGQNALGGIQGVGQNALGGIQGAGHNGIGGVQGVGQNALGGIQGAGQNALGGIQGAGQNALGGIQGAGQNALGGIQGAGQNALGGIQGAGQNALGGIQGAGQQVVGGIKDPNRDVDEASTSAFKTQILEQAKLLSDKLNTVQDIVNASKDPAFKATSTQADIIASNMAKYAGQIGEQVQADVAPLLENPANKKDEAGNRAEDQNKDLNSLVNDSSNTLRDYLQKELLNPLPVDLPASTAPKCIYSTSEKAKESFVELYDEQVNGARLPNLTDALSLTSVIKKAYNSNGVVGKVIVVMMLILTVAVFVICLISFTGMTTEKKLATTACLAILMVVIFIFKLN